MLCLFPFCRGANVFFFALEALLLIIFILWYASTCLSGRVVALSM